MLAAVRSGEADVAVASRFAEGASTQGWGRPDREKLSGFANTLARKLTGVELSDPMSGYFLLRTATARALAPRLSAIGFKILLDLLATSEKTLTVRDFPMDFAARRAGESKLDRAVAFDFLAGLYDKSFGRLIPTRFALGFMKSMDNRHRPFGHIESCILGERAFGHVGAGGSIGFADPDCELAFGYTMNRMGAGLLLNDRGQAVVDAAYRALGYRTDAPGVWVR
jgi:hypothetical protein